MAKNRACGWIAPFTPIFALHRRGKNKPCTDNGFRLV
jgi:hypothetical protein